MARHTMERKVKAGIGRGAPGSSDPTSEAGYGRAEALMQEICWRSNPQKRKNVEAFWGILQRMREKGVHVFTAAQVGRECEAAGILKPQSIRNKAGSDYRALIEVFAGEIAASGSRPAGAKVTPLEAAIEGSVDLDIRIRLRATLEENRRQRVEIDRLKEAFKHLRLRDESLPAPPPEHRGESSPTPLALPGPRGDLDVAPVLQLLSEDWIDERRWTLDESKDALYSEDGERITPIGFVTALRQLLNQRGGS